MFGNRGQQFAVMKLMIGAVFAVALLLLVYQVVNTIPTQPASGASVIKEILTSARNGQDLCFGPRQVSFKKGEAFSEKEITSTSADCLVEASFADAASCSGCGCSFNQAITLPVLAKCAGTRCTVFIGYENCP